MVSVKIMDYDDRNERNKDIAPKMVSYFMKKENITTFAEILIDKLPTIFDNGNEYSVELNLPEPKKNRVRGILEGFENIEIVDNNS